MMFNVRESLLFAWGVAAGILAIGIYVEAGRPGFGTVVMAAGLLVMIIIALFGHPIARAQERTVGRVVGVRITVLYLAASYTLLLLFIAAVGAVSS